MEINPYTAQYRELWSEFINASVNGTIFHRHEFLDYHPAGRFRWHHLVLGKLNDPKAVLPAAIHTDDEGRETLRSPMGATLGGPALMPRLGLQRTVELVRSLIDYAQQQRLDGIVLGTVPSVYWKQPDETLEFVLRANGFQGTPQLGHCVYLQSLSSLDVIESIPARRRQRFRQALKQGLELKLAASEGELAEFYEILVANKANHGARPVHSLPEIVDLHQRLGERLQIFTARKDGRMIAGVYCVAATRSACYVQYIADDPQCRQHNAPRFILFHMLSALRQQGFSCLDLGPSAILPIESAGLAAFKECFGAVGCARTEWRLVLQHQRASGVASKAAPSKCSISPARICLGMATSPLVSATGCGE